MITTVDAWALGLPGAHARFTTVADGNLALHVGDDPARVAAHRALLERECGVPLVFVNQVHSPTVVTVKDSAHAHQLSAAPVDADAMVTSSKDVALAIMVADCVPVLLSDPHAGVVAAAHAGRRGLLDGVLENTVSAMVSEGASAERISAVVGPSVCGRCYEVPSHMRDDAARINSATPSTTSWGTPALDLPAGAKRALENAGLGAESVTLAGVCTMEVDAYFSYRRDPHTGRFAGIVRIV